MQLVATFVTCFAKQLPTTQSPTFKRLSTPNKPASILDPCILPSDDTITQSLVITFTTTDDTTWLSKIPPILTQTTAHYRVDAPLSRSVSALNHAHRRAWHQKLDALDELRLLRPAHILRVGYACLHCPSGTSECESATPLAGGMPGPFNVFTKMDRKQQLFTLLDAFLEPEKGVVVPERLAASCCA